MTQWTRFSIIRKRKSVFKKKKCLLLLQITLNHVKNGKLMSATKSLANTAANHGGETLQRWRAENNTVSNLKSLGMKPQTCHTEVDANTKKKFEV